MWGCGCGIAGGLRRGGEIEQQRRKERQATSHGDSTTRGSERRRGEEVRAGGEGERPCVDAWSRLSRLEAES